MKDRTLKEVRATVDDLMGAVLVNETNGLRVGIKPITMNQSLYSLPGDPQVGDVYRIDSEGFLVTLVVTAVETK